MCSLLVIDATCIGSRNYVLKDWVVLDVCCGLVPVMARKSIMPNTNKLCNHNPRPSTSIRTAHARVTPYHGIMIIETVHRFHPPG
jgi:hypothetical protein